MFTRVLRCYVAPTVFATRPFTNVAEGVDILRFSADFLRQMSGDGVTTYGLVWRTGARGGRGGLVVVVVVGVGVGGSYYVPSRFKSCDQLKFSISNPVIS